MKKTPKSAKPQHPQGNIIPAIPANVAKQQFMNAMSRSRESSNSHVEKFLLVIENVLAARASFTLQDVIYHSLPYEIPPLEVKLLLSKWVEMMEMLNRVTLVDGAYDDKLIVVI